MTGNLATTNLLLGIMAIVAVFEALVAIGVGVAAFSLYRRASTLLTGIEERQIAPAVARINAILDDVKGVTSTMKEETRALRSTVNRVEETADRVRSNVRVRTSRLVGVLRGVRVAIEEMLADREPRTEQPF
ncbi:MAG TPA: hypothetical protein VH583_06925 [Vicinamibacterales bacterium]|jgi:hypothetical protein